MRRPVSLVSYSSSDEDGSENSASMAPRKKRKLPELPSSLTPQIPLDNPALHQGRIRTTLHVEGQFAAYVYVPLILDARSPLRKAFKQSYAYAKMVVPSLHPIGQQNTDSSEKSSEARVSKLEHGDGSLELHISLTRPTYLRAHQREDFKRAVKAIAQSNRTFNASFASFSELTNDERTRTFLTAEIGAGHQELKALSDALVPTLRAIKRQEFYSKPRFHVSIGWALLDHPRTIEKDRNSSSSTPTSPPSSRQLSPGISNQVSEEETSNSNKPSQPSPPQTSSSHRFPTISSLPASLLSDLNRMFGSSLSSRHIGMFEVREIGIRIGKEVSRWPLAC